MLANVLPSHLELVRDTQTLLTRSRQIIAELRAARRRCPVRRLQRLAAGASDGEATSPPALRRHETWKQRCPRCQSDTIEHMGRITAEGGLLKIALRCGACTHPFVFVRTPVLFASPGPTEPPPTGSG